MEEHEGDCTAHTVVPTQRRVSGLSVASVWITSYWVTLTAFTWASRPLPGAILGVFAGGGLILAASLLLPSVTGVIDFAVIRRKPRCSVAGESTAYDRTCTSLTVAFLMILGMSIPFLVGFALGMLGMRQADRSCRTIYGYALARGCMLTCLVGLPVLLAIFVGQVKEGNRRRDEWQRCRDNVATLGNMWESHGGPWLGSQWSDEAVHHLAEEIALVCPSAPGVRCGYALNGALDGLRHDAIEAPECTVAIFESDGGWNAVGGPELLPHEPRHLGCDCYVMADGRPTWLPRKKNPDGTWAKEPEADWVIWEPVLKEEVEGPGTSGGDSASE